MQLCHLAFVLWHCWLYVQLKHTGQNKYFFVMSGCLVYLNIKKVNLQFTALLSILLGCSRVRFQTLLNHWLKCWWVGRVLANQVRIREWAWFPARKWTLPSLSAQRWFVMIELSSRAGSRLRPAEEQKWKRWFWRPVMGPGSRGTWLLTPAAASVTWSGLLSRCCRWAAEPWYHTGSILWPPLAAWTPFLSS